MIMTRKLIKKQTSNEDGERKVSNLNKDCLFDHIKMKSKYQAKNKETFEPDYQCSVSKSIYFAINIAKAPDFFLSQLSLISAYSLS